MNNTNGEFFEKRVCSICSNEMDRIISSTKSTYYYCNNCMKDEEKSFKNMRIDDLLKKLQQALLKGKNKTIENINISILREYDNLKLNVNDSLVESIDINLTEKDIYSLNNIIEYLVEDIFEEGKVRLSINIS
ncbi:MAG: hypothetical protein RRZ84_05340 [Romboutsia sp.]